MIAAEAFDNFPDFEDLRGRDIVVQLNQTGGLIRRGQGKANPRLNPLEKFLYASP
jgi:hypothetical protein